MTLSAEQLQNAQAIVSAGSARGESSTNITIALMVALTESGLRNLTYGDRDSVGLFQQRASWGSVATRENPTASANLFYDRLDHVNTGSLSPWLAAQAVQISAFADGSNYKAQYATAQSAYQQVTGSAPTGGTSAVTASATSVLGGWSTVLTNLDNRSFWVRVGIGVLGAVLVAIAAYRIFDGSSAQSAIKSTTNTVKGLTNAGS